MPGSKTSSRTDWKRVRREIAEDVPIPYDPEEGPYDPNDANAVDAYWNHADIFDAKGKLIRRGRGPQKSPTKERITIRLSAEVVDHFRSGGEGWQTRMNDVLCRWVRRHRSA